MTNHRKRIHVSPLFARFAAVRKTPGPRHSINRHYIAEIIGDGVEWMLHARKGWRKRSLRDATQEVHETEDEV